MPTNFTVTVVNSEDDDPIKPGAVGPTISGVRNFLNGLVGGLSTNPVTLYVFPDSAFATGTVTFVGPITATPYTITIGGAAVNVTGVAGDTFATAAAAAAAINANPTTAALVRATSSGAVVSLKAVVGGLVGNTVTLTAAGTPTPLASGSGFLAGGDPPSSFTF